jgi:hypothetical protein
MAFYLACITRGNASWLVLGRYFLAENRYFGFIERHVGMSVLPKIV